MDREDGDEGRGKGKLKDWPQTSALDPLVGGATLVPESFGRTYHIGAKTRIFNRYSPVASQP